MGEARGCVDYSSGDEGQVGNASRKERLRRRDHVEGLGAT